MFETRNMLPFFFCLMLVAASCKKDDPETVIRYISDVQNEFTTSLTVAYDQDENLTTACAFFWDEVPGSVAVREEILRLASNSYVNFNGVGMTFRWGGFSFPITFQDAVRSVIPTKQVVFTTTRAEESHR